AREPSGVEAVSDAEVFRMIRDCEVAQTAGLCGGGHLLEGVAAVRGVRMGVKISLQIGALDQSRQRPMFGRLDFAAILAQFRRNPRKTERRVYFFLRGSRETLGAAEQSVLAELQAFLLRQTPDPDALVVPAACSDCRSSYRSSALMGVAPWRAHTTTSRSPTVSRPRR